MARTPRLIRFDTAAYVFALAGPMLLAAGFMASHECSREDAAGLDTELATVKLVPMPVPVPRAVSVPHEVKVPVPVASAVREGEIGSAVLVHDGRLVFTTEAEKSWATGPVEADPDFEGHIENIRAIRALRPDVLDPELAAALSGSYDVYGPEGRVCTVRVDNPHLAAEFYGWESYEDLWTVYDDAEGEPTQAEITAAVDKVRPQVWDNEQLWLVSDLVSDRGEDCSGGLWARHTSLPAPDLLSLETGKTSESRKVFKSLLASEDMVRMKEDFESFRESELDSEYEDYSEYDIPWSRFTNKTLNVQNWVDAKGDVQVVSLESGAWESCSSFYFYDGATYSTATETFEDLEFHGMPRSVFDLDGDGRYERIIAGDDGVTLVDGRGEVRSAEIYFSGCPC